MKFQGTFGTNFSGSLAGTTASRNKGGQYLKERSNPVQPNTIAQQSAKAAFGAASSIFGTFIASEKTLWNQMAQTIFSPRMATNEGQFSGFQAFQSLQTAFSASIRIGRTYAIQVNGAPLTGGDTRAPFVPPIGTPPNLPSSPNWQAAGGIDLPFTVTAGVLKVDGTVGFTLQVGNGLGADMSNFQNPEGQNFGFLVMLSNGNAQVNQSYSNPENNVLGYFPIPVATDEADLDATNNIDLLTTDLFDISRYRAFPLFGQSALLTIYMVNQTMQIDRIGVIEVQVTS